MEASQILHSHVLDIIFDGRNKLYGAYQLRKTYQRRIITALTGTLLFIGLFISVLIFLRHAGEEHPPAQINIPDKKLWEAPNDKKKIVIPAHRQAAAKAPTVKSIRIEVVQDKFVVDPPPDVKELEHANIGVQTLPGNGGEADIISPPSDIRGSGVLADVKSQTETGDFKPVEIDAEFPGGARAWQRYIKKAIDAQLDEFTEADYGTCTVKFIVDAEGRVSEVEALDMKGSKLAEIAVNAIRKGPRWTPAIQNGRYVKAVRIQPVTLLNPHY